MARAVFVLPVVVAALALSACGGGGGSVPEAGSSPSPPPPPPPAAGTPDADDTQVLVGKSPPYKAAFNICIAFPLEELARQNGVAAKPEAVAEKVASLEATPAGKRQARRGCLDAIELGTGRS